MLSGEPPAPAGRLGNVTAATAGSRSGEPVRDSPAAVGPSAAPPEALFAAHYAPLVAWSAALLGGDGAAADDVAAEAFVRLLAHWRRVRHPRAFLYAAAANLVRDRWRRAGRERRAWQLLDEPGTAADGAGSYEVRDLIRRLPGRLQAPLLLHYYADLPVAEVARTLHRPAGTVKRQLGEARALLAQFHGGDGHAVR